MRDPQEVRIPLVQMLSLTAIATPLRNKLSVTLSIFEARLRESSRSMERKLFSSGFRRSAESRIFSMSETIDICYQAPRADLSLNGVEQPFIILLNRDG